MKVIAETVLKYYPDHVESLSNLAVISLIKKDYDAALEMLLKAEKIAPKDFVVLGNLLQTIKNLLMKAKQILRYYAFISSPKLISLLNSFVSFI